MDKTTLINDLADEVNLDVAEYNKVNSQQVAAILDKFSAMVRRALMQKGKVKIHGLGMFVKRSSGRRPLDADDQLMDVSLSIQGVDCREVLERIDQIQFMIDVIKDGVAGNNHKLDQDQFRQMSRDLNAFELSMFSEAEAKKLGMTLKKNEHGLLMKGRRTGEFEKVFHVSQFKSVAVS